MRLLHFFAALALLLGSAISHAANVNFNGGDVSNCSRENNLYTCTVLSTSDAISIASGYGVTVNSKVTLDYNQSFAMSGTASLTVNGNIDFSNINTPNLKVTGGSITAKGGVFQLGSQNGQSIVADISAASVSLGGTPVRITGNITATGGIDISAGSTLNGAISGATVTTNSKVTITGSVKASDTLSIGSNSVISGPVSGATVTTSSNVAITGDVTASKSFSLGSSSNLKGNTTAPVVSIDPANSEVQGNITASTSLTVGSGSQVTGNLISPSIDLKASNLLVTGDVKASKTLIISSGNGINGNVEGGNVTLEAANAYITGNALVDHITLESKGRVRQTITCKAYTPSNPCSCVTNNSGWTFSEPQGPKCGPGTQAGPHHFQITHPPSALTCAPAPVTVTACADAVCSSVYTGAAQVTLTPGGATAQINNTQPPTGMVNSSVAQTAPASSVLLGLTSTPVTTGALVCRSSIDNSVTNCRMEFATSALQVSGLPRYAEEAGKISISALQVSPSNPRACVPLFAGQSKTLSLSCTYANPSSGTLPARIQGKDGNYVPLAANDGSACSVAGADVQLAFDANGEATPNMLYADAGALSLTAKYTSGSGSGSGLTMTGSGSVIVGPTYFTFSAIATPQRAGLAVTGVKPATVVSVSARNALKAVTPNFGREATAPTVLLGRTVVEPTFTGHAEPLADGSLGFNGGVLTATGMSWKEVGFVQFTASLINYLGWQLPAVNGVVPPLASGASDQVQFIPHHFITEIVPQPDVSKPQFPAACVAPLICSSGKYVYSGQPFDLRVTARNAADATTVNYDGRAKTLMAPVTLQGLAPVDDKIVFPPAAPAGSRLTDGSSAQTTVKEVALDKFLLGVATQSVAYRFPGAYAMPAGAIALAPPTDVRFRASSTYASDDVVSSGPAAPKTEGELTVLTGRVMVPNSYGSERLPIRLPVQVQYWNSGWLGNVSDSVTQFGSAGVTFANCSKGLTSGAGACNGVAKVQDGTYAFKQGVLPPPKGLLVLLAPGVAGSVDVSVSGLPYLPSTQGRAVFGVFKSGPVIYLREMY